MLEGSEARPQLLRFRRSRKTCGGSFRVAASGQILGQAGSGFGAADYSAPNDTELSPKFKNRGEGFSIEPNALFGRLGKPAPGSSCSIAGDVSPAILVQNALACQIAAQIRANSDEML